MLTPSTHVSNHFRLLEPLLDSLFLSLSSSSSTFFPLSRCSKNSANFEHVRLRIVVLSVTFSSQHLALISSTVNGESQSLMRIVHNGDLVKRRGLDIC